MIFRSRICLKTTNKITSLSNTKKVLLLTILIIVQILFLNVQSVFKPLDIFLILIKAALLVLILEFGLRFKEKGNEKFCIAIYLSVVIMFTVYSLLYITYKMTSYFTRAIVVNEQNHENLDASIYEVIQFNDYTGYYKGVEGSNHLIYILVVTLNMVQQPFANLVT